MSIHVKSYVMTVKADIANLSADNMLLNRLIRVSYINVIAEHAVQGEILK